MTETIHLEGYSLPLRRQKVFCVGDINTIDKLYFGLYNMYNEEVLKRNKIILIFSDNYLKHNPKWIRNIYCDAIFRIKEAKDLQLAYTYIQHCFKPALIIWYANELPQMLFNSLNNSKDDITLITGGMNTPKYDYSSIFWSTKSSYEEVANIINTKMKNIDIKTILQETKGSDVSLVWSSIGESDKKGSLYWFDYNSIKTNIPSINFVQASEYLRNLADILEIT